MRPTILCSVFLLSAVVTSLNGAEAATINAASCSFADVASAVSRATHGDTVSIPPGDCTWTSQLNVSVGITLSGAGQGITTIRDNVVKDGGPSSRLMAFNVSSPNRFRISDFTLVGVAADSQIFNQGHIAIAGTSKAFRIDHITANSPQTSVVRTFGELWGVIDHVTVNGNKPLLQAGHDRWGGSAYGDGSWAEQLYLGTEKAIYVEDCVMTANNSPYTSGLSDAVDGARVVIRHNTLTQTAIGAHGTDSSQRRRSVRSQEIYNNKFTFPSSMSPDFIAWFRGGTGVMFNNTIIAPGGVNWVARHTNLRDSGAYPPWGSCNGTSPYDGNQSGQTGYRCVDQPGAGTSKHLNGVSTPPSEPVGNISDPIYVWDNTVNGTANNCGNASWGCGSQGHVVAGRDIIFGSARPGYTPFVYPHPLVTGGLTSTAGDNTGTGGTAGSTGGTTGSTTATLPAPSNLQVR